MIVTSGFDAAWGGVGWAVGTQDGPLSAGWFRPSNKSKRLPALKRELRQVEHAIVDAESLLGPNDKAHRVAVERVPWSYNRRGSQVRTVYGIGTCVGAVAFWGSREGWAHPWEIPPSSDLKKKKPIHGWRTHWRITTKGRAGKKLAAVRLVQASGWGRFLQGFSLDYPGDTKPFPAGDMAEGILIQVGTARMYDRAPL